MTNGYMFYFIPEIIIFAITFPNLLYYFFIKFNSLISFKDIYRFPLVSSAD